MIVCGTARTMEGKSLHAGVKRRRIYCEHCENHLTKSTYYRHKSKFFDVATKTWAKDRIDEDNPIALTSSDSEENCSLINEDVNNCVESNLGETDVSGSPSTLQFQSSAQGITVLVLIQ